MKKRGIEKWDDPSKMKGMIILKINFKGRRKSCLKEGDEGRV